VDLVGIEPTTSSMPWKKHGSRRLILKELATGTLVKNGYIGRYFRPISGQIFHGKNIAELHGRGFCGWRFIEPEFIFSYCRNLHVNAGRVVFNAWSCKGGDDPRRVNEFARMFLRERSVQNRTSQADVFTVSNGVAHHKIVKLGHRGDYEIELLEGVNETASVVIHPNPDLKDDVRVIQRSSRASA
jgi:hypothetical protein